MFFSPKRIDPNSKNISQWSRMAAENISESVFVGLCLKIGTSKQVASRRDMMDISEKLEHNVLLYNQPKQMISGSMRDGFRLDGTDIDIMFWPGNHRVIWDFSQFQFYNTQEVVLILCDNFESPPGFTLLWLPLERASRIVSQACIRMNGILFISSSKYRDITCSIFFLWVYTTRTMWQWIISW